MPIFKDMIESFRYSNHIWPVFFLRQYLAYYFLYASFFKKSLGYLEKPLLSAKIDENLIRLDEAPFVIKAIYLNLVQENWLFWSKFLVYFEWFVGLFFVFGFLVRPMGFLAILYLYFVSFVATEAALSGLYQILVITFFLLVFGAGRVGGVDYFFYKRQRGLIW